jgi:uncharacterized coiled-coil protein SlyX
VLAYWYKSTNTDTTLSILRNEVVQQQEQLKQNAKLIEALTRQVEEAEEKIKVLENPSSALPPPISREHQPPLRYADVC